VSENSESSRRGFAAFSRGDIDAMLTEMDPEIEWHVTFPFPDLPPGTTVFRGHEEVKDLFVRLLDVWEELTIELEEVLYDADDLLIERVRFHGRGAGSGAEAERVIHYVQDIRDTKLLRIRPFDTEAEAFAAAGVER
jgi:ketosteroid isomerase-like protein